MHRNLKAEMVRRNKTINQLALEIGVSEKTLRNKINGDTDFTLSLIHIFGENINQLSDTLEHTISELKTANNELKKDIQKKEEIDQMRREFLSNVSHELKTPIALIQGYAEGLLEDVNSDPESGNFTATSLWTKRRR